MNLKKPWASDLSPWSMVIVFVFLSLFSSEPYSALSASSLLCIFVYDSCLPSIHVCPSLGTSLWILSPFLEVFLQSLHSGDVCTTTSPVQDYLLRSSLVLLDIFLHDFFPFIGHIGLSCPYSSSICQEVPLLCFSFRSIITARSFDRIPFCQHSVYGLYINNFEI